ncbi:xanthine dehydrogenase family protein molybdopterin-binding subunit [Emergencia timonensis]|uniref:xanthine dehydrogenase family protein molybdopterin-binding subunit n=1 Tax=Emergencia timonensis TaxID=1776384 RepID=UPI003992FFF6
MMKAHESLIGQRIIKPDAAAKVTGEARFTADLAVHRTDLLYAKALFPPYGHAKIVSIDTSEAEAVEGVEIVMTAKDLPTESSNRYGLDEHDKPVLAEEKVIYEGDAVAILAARDLKTAEEAVSLIKVEYEPLPAYDDPREVFEREAGLIHEKHPFSGDSNISYSAGIDHGNIEEVFAKADVVLDNYFETPMVDHAYLEPDVCIAEPDLVQGGITIYSPQHNVQGAKKALCGVLGLPQSKIRVISTIVGGAFGGKEDSTFDVSAIAGVLALKTRKPVYYEETRDEVFRTTGKRHAAFLHHRLASDKTGRILAIDVFNIIDKGAYQSVDAIPDRTLLYAGGPYKISASRVSAHSVYTNHPYGCAFRGLGAPQAHFAIECQMDMLAHELGMDPIELRLKNIVRGGDAIHTGQVMLEERGVGLEECLLKVKDALKWNEKSNQGHGSKKRGKGVACFMYGIGTGSSPDGAHCIVQAQRDGSVNIGLSSNELGQGLLVAMKQIAGEALCVSPDKIHVDYSDSSSSLEAGATVSSRTTTLMGNAVLAGCKKLKERFIRHAAEEIFRVGTASVDMADNLVFVKGKPETAMTLGEVISSAYKAQVPLSAIGSWFPPRVYPKSDNTHDQMHAFTFGTCGVEVEVDTETGELTILRCILACDVGKAINPSTVEGQMEGGMAQGIGWGIMEEHFMEKGTMKNHTYHDFLIPTALDLPKLETIIVEHPNELGPYGAKGIGEPPIVGIAPAIRNALFDATGVFVNSIPLTPVRVMAALKKPVEAR